MRDFPHDCGTVDTYGNGEHRYKCPEEGFFNNRIKHLLFLLDYNLNDKEHCTTCSRQDNWNNRSKKMESYGWAFVCIIMDPHS